VSHVYLNLRQTRVLADELPQSFAINRERSAAESCSFLQDDALDAKELSENN
jgi:hypothetical protein